MPTLVTSLILSASYLFLLAVHRFGPPKDA